MQKNVILEMDNSSMNKDGITKILKNMIPSDEEITMIHEAQYANPDIPLATAEQFLITLSSINELPVRLKLWLFNLDYDSRESVDWQILHQRLDKLELIWKASWDNLRSIIEYSDGSTIIEYNDSSTIIEYNDSSTTQVNSRMTEFLLDTAWRIMHLQIDHKRVCDRYSNLLQYLGYSASAAKDLKVSDFCKMISDFALEYSTTRENVCQLNNMANRDGRKKCKKKR